MKIAILNDTHFGIHNNSPLFFDYQRTFYEDVFFPYLKENNIRHIWHLGDFFDHRKQININTLFSTRKMFLEPLVENGIFMTIIPGNHDTFYKNTIRVTSLKELLGYFTGNIEIIMNPKVKRFDKTEVAFIPWITNENYNETMRFLHVTDVPVVCAHLELTGFDLMKGMKSHDGMDPSIFRKFDKVLTGHFHTKSHQDNIYYLGSQMEFTWSDWNDNKYFHVYDTEINEIIPVRNPHTLFAKIFYKDEIGKNLDKFSFSDYNGKFIKIIVEEKNDAYLFETFIDRLQQNVKNLHELKIIESYSHFIPADSEEIFNLEEEEASSLSIDTTQLMINYIDYIETSLNKDKLKKHFMGLHAEAVTALYDND